MNDYTAVATELRRVRRAWKRAAALAGLVRLLVESIAIFGLFLLVDFLYGPIPEVRLVIFFVALSGIGYLLVRHVLSPLLRQIPDAQIALYVEEHQKDFAGSLITAAEFGPGPRRPAHDFERALQADSPIRQEMVRTVIDEALARTRRMSLRSVIDFSRLRRYSAVAAALVIVYGVMSVSFPGVEHHAFRVLRPWQPTAEDLPPALQPVAYVPPIEFALSRGTCRILRGTSLDVEALLSRSPERRVVLRFRALPAEGQPEGAWHEIVMKEIEKLHGFAGVLADVNEDMEFCVRSGEYESPVSQVRVYDPLVVTGLELTTRFPAYLKLPDRVETVASADVSAPEGSRVTVRLLANRPLTAARLQWREGAAPVDMALDPARETTAVASFDIPPGEAFFRYRVNDADGQDVEGADWACVRGLKDEPPAIALELPADNIETHPLGQLTVTADAQDDYGIDKAELSYTRNLPDGRVLTGRQPLAVARPERKDAAATPDLGKARLVFRLDQLNPPARPEEVLFCHAEVLDRKGQMARTDMRMVSVGHFETWTTFLGGHPHEETEETKLLLPYVTAAWSLHGRKDRLGEADYQGQSRELAVSMISPETGSLYKFWKREQVAPEKIHYCEKADVYIAQGHKELQASDTGKATDSLRLALAQLTLAGIADTDAMLLAAGGADQAEEKQKEMAALFERAMAEAQPINAEKPDPEKQKKEAEQQAKLRETAKELQRQQEEIIREAQQRAEREVEAKPEPKPAAAPEPTPADRELARKQQELADKTRKAADEIKREAKPDAAAAKRAENLDEAKRHMEQAARRMQEGEMKKAVESARQARARLEDLQNQSAVASQQELEARIAAAEARTARILEQQREVRKQTEELAQKAKPAADPQAQSEMKKALNRQVQLKADLTELTARIADVRKSAETAGKGETQKHIEEAQRTIQRNRPEQKMTDAAVDLSAQKATPAAKEQKEAEASLEKVLTSLTRAADSLASDRESELRRATAEAQRVVQGLSEMATAPKPEPEPGRPPEATPPPANAQAKGQPPPPPPPLTPEQKAQKAQEVAFELKRLAEHLERREFADKSDREAVKTAARDPAAAAAIAREEPKRDELIRTVRRISNSLEAEYQAMLEAKRLITAQREDCPPQYRALVNRYYEKLSGAKK